MKRRDFISLVGGAAAWPLAARAQQADRIRRVGILMPYAVTDTEIQTRVRALRQELQKRGWTEGGNVQFDEHWTTDDRDLIQAHAADLLASKPDVVVAIGRVIPVLMNMTGSIPIVFPGSGDPVGTGLVKSLARPGGNVTGFSLLEFSIIGKMMEMLKQIAPGTSRVAMVYNHDNHAAAFYARSFEGFAAPLGIVPIRAPIHGMAELERAIEMLVETQNGAVLFATDLTVTVLRDQVVALMARHRLPAIYSDSVLVKSGGLISYAADRVDLYRHAGSYVDRILRGENPAELPVQQPTKYELVINLKTARAAGLDVPQILLARADEVIE